MDADSSLIVAQVVPALSVPCGPVQEWAPETQQQGWGSLTFAPCSLGYQPCPSLPAEGFLMTQRVY